MSESINVNKITSSSLKRLSWGNCVNSHNRDLNKKAEARINKLYYILSLVSSADRVISSSQFSALGP